MQAIRTERLLIRPFETTDLDGFLAYLGMTEKASPTSGGRTFELRRESETER